MQSVSHFANCPSQNSKMAPSCYSIIGKMQNVSLFAVCFLTAIEMAPFR